LITLHPLQLSVARKFQATPEMAWNLLTDTNQWPRWGPTVRKVDCSDRYIRFGSRGYVRTPLGLRLPFRVVDYEHGFYWKWKVAGIQATGHRLVVHGANLCSIAFEIPLYGWPYFIVCQVALRRIGRILL
jgi:hypothetical protein